MRFKTVQSIEIEVNRNGEVTGKILLFEMPLELEGKLEYFTPKGVYTYPYEPFKKELNKEIMKSLPIKLKLVSKGGEVISPEYSKEHVENFINFWKKGAKVLSLSVSADAKNLTIKLEGIVGKSYSSYSKRDELDFLLDINSVKILESKNVPGLKDVKK
jgi:hypothetical protein